MTFGFLLRAILLTCLTVAGWVYIVRQQEQWREGGEAMAGCEVAGVIDARTIRLSCDGAPVLARLQGIAVPDVDDPACEAELAHGALGRDRLRLLLEDGGAEVFRQGLGEVDAPLPVRVTVAGEDLADRLVREGLAVEAEDGARVNWCDRLGTVLE